MARIPLVDPSSPSSEGDEQPVRQPLDGMPGSIHPNVYRAIANHPEALHAFGGFGRLLYTDPSITPAQRELAYLTASVVNNCHY